ncbi:hypothetical protein BN1232_02236 [Mycobacterium lentiflavum]|uniref:Uncharacterized protein n=1 Tax=Mycobacterium lentiflavum TaxID=141349 RepID=A0A0E4GX45_MYCLN|nr:hypothetical protein [Mycobacterium lentiflavum]CQD11871.1 hypothetical protein BN1232_02236 [Mycobacterium lentiflavum]
MNQNNKTDAPILLRPELLTFSPIKADAQHVLRIIIHTGNLGKFVFPVAPTQAKALSDTLLDYVGQVSEYDRQQLV